MNKIDKTKEIAKQILKLTIGCEFVELYIKEDKSGTIEIDDVTFIFDKEGNIIRTRLFL